jgi:hypothetical protein
MKYQDIIFKPELLEPLLTSSSSPFMRELLKIISNARKVVWANQFDESLDTFKMVINDIFNSPVTPLIDEEILNIEEMSYYFSEAMHESKGFSFNTNPRDILNNINGDPVLWCCYLIQWSCEMLCSNSSSIEQLHKIKIVECQLNWISAAKQLLYYSENRFVEEDKNRVKAKPHYDYGRYIVQSLTNKGVEFEEIKLVSEAITCLLKSALKKFNEGEALSKSEIMAFDIQQVINHASTKLLTKSAVTEVYEEKWDKQYGKKLWRVEKNEHGSFLLITSNNLKHFLNTKSPEKSMSAALREKLSLSLKSGKRPESLIKSTIDMLCKELKLNYQVKDKIFNKV